MEINKFAKRATTVFLFSLLCLVSFAQEKIISGKVSDTSGIPMIGVTVAVQGTTIGTVTDVDGNFSLKVPKNGKLQFSFIGFITQTFEVGNQTSFNITLKETAMDLNEVVVVGYGTMKKSDLTGSVGSVNAQSLVAKGTSMMMESLQGEVAGVNITQSGSRDQAGFDIQIRGKSSINADVKPLYVVDGVICGDIDFLNPQDIERIDILKDASSTAIYGSRATAGVVQVTTKSGTTVGKKAEAKPIVSYDGYYGLSQIARMPDFMDGQEFYNFRFKQFLTTSESTSQPVYRILQADHQQSMLYDGTSKYVLPEALKNGQTYDWPNMVTQNSREQNHYLAVSGTSQSVNYHFGAGFNKNEGTYVGDNQSRFNLKGSIDSEINKYLSAGMNFNMAYTLNDYGSDDGIKVAFRMNPFNKPYDSEGNTNVKPGNYQSMGTASNQFTDAYNPLVYLSDQEKEKKSYRILGNIYLEARPIKNISLKSTFSPNYSHARTGEYTGNATGGTATGKYTSTESFDWTWDNQINYNVTSGDHSFGAMGLFSMNSYNYEKYYIEVTNPTVGTTWYNLGTGSSKEGEKPTVTSEYSENSLVSYALRANYSYKGKYMITATVRSDGSSKFADGHRWGTFPSAAIAWRASEEEFLKANWLSNLKIRLSYGVTGNNAGIGNYATQTTGDGPNYYAFGTVSAPAYYPSGVVNAALSWESTAETNFGIDFGLFSSRVNGTIDIYNKDSKNLLYIRSLPLVSGGGTLTDNIGNVRNRGIEFSLNTVNITGKDLKWETTFTFAANKNEVLEINGTSDFIINSDNPITRSLFLGEAVNNIYAFNWEGIVSDKMMTVPDNGASAKGGFTPGLQVKEADYYYKIYSWTEGMPIIEDINKDGVIDADNDKKVRGSQDPAWTGNVSSSLTYKNWDFSFSIYTKQNYKVLSSFLYEYYNYAYRGYQKLNMDYYIPAGTLVNCDRVNDDGTYVNPVYQEQTHYGEFPFPNGNSVTNYGAGTVWLDKGNSNLASIVDASYWKVKYIVLGYTFPKAKLKKIGVQKLRVYVNVTNPFVISSYKGFDPEWAGSTTQNDGPSTINYQLGINLKF
jgi:TonB-dependent starch-binding outer membrane protein SusC